MKRALHTVAIAFAISLAAISVPAHAQKARPVQGENGNSVLEFSDQDQQMNAAIAEARETLPAFLALLENPPEGAHSFHFKFPLGGYEHIWVHNVRLEGGQLHGTLGNHPFQEGWSRGDAVRVPLSEVSDWAYVDADGYTHGSFTTRVMLLYMAPADAAQVRAAYGW